jgi:hypothetical protein
LRAQGTVKAARVVKGFDVIEELSCGLVLIECVSRGERFGFECGKEGLGQGVFVTVAFAAHAGGDVISGQ